MEISTDQVKKVLSGDLKFSQLGFSMMVTRLKGVYSKNPTYEVLKDCAREMHAFIEKYESIMTQDIALICKL